ncbi:hypothetical protein [Enterobacter mori]|uniref:hypothetical protein n=1 Tax=Enterobacter mori TaxID=539813 RepID=UPI003B83DF1B
MLELVFIYKDAYAFLERHRKDPFMTRLTISCHGSNDRRVKIDDIYMNAMQLSHHIRREMRGRNIHALRTIRLVSCLSANLDPMTYRARLEGGNSSIWSSAFGAQLSLSFPDIRIKSYIGDIDATCGLDETWELYNIAGRSLTEWALSNRFTLTKKVDLNIDFENPFRCVTFLNGSAIKQSQQITHEDGRDYFQL